MATDPPKTENCVKGRVVRWVLVGVGWSSVVCGVVGIFLPLLPSVPFLLLACLCFSQSSERFHRWLVEHRYLGPLVRDYLDARGIPVRAKLTAVAMIWISVTASTLLMKPDGWITFLMVAAAAGVTWYIASRPTASAAGNRGGPDSRRGR